MNYYIGVRMCLAEPNIKEGIGGYLVSFTNGHQGWYPKEVFESIYCKLHDSTGTSVLEEDVDKFIKHVSTNPIGADTMLTHAITKNNYDVYTVFPSSLDDPNLNHQLGLSQIKVRVFRALAFMLKWGRTGLTGINK